MEQSLYIPIISDYRFKATFGNETDTLFLRIALQALTNSAVPIREVLFEKNAFEALTIDSRSERRPAVFTIWLARMKTATSSLSRCS